MLSVPSAAHSSATPTQLSAQTPLEFDLDYSSRTIAWFLGFVKWVKRDGKEEDLLKHKVIMEVQRKTDYYTTRQTKTTLAAILPVENVFEVLTLCDQLDVNVDAYEANSMTRRRERRKRQIEKHKEEIERRLGGEHYLSLSDSQRDQ